jgi:hypothetical protein
MNFLEDSQNGGLIADVLAVERDRSTAANTGQILFFQRGRVKVVQFVYHCDFVAFA